MYFDKRFLASSYNWNFGNGGARYTPKKSQKIKTKRRKKHKN